MQSQMCCLSVPLPSRGYKESSGYLRQLQHEAILFAEHLKDQRSHSTCKLLHQSQVFVQ
ncbi:hypothetical protein HanIR_Chr09g0410661 [Helianthus annuus]|nr:hypothetical protein HanIR_Chr09g0410661 [Helianthus annuus]